MPSIRPSPTSRDRQILSVIVGIVAIVLAIIKFLEPHDYPLGDPRNEPLFWLAVVGIAVVFGLLLSVSAVVPRAWDIPLFRLTAAALTLGGTIAMILLAIAPGVR